MYWSEVVVYWPEEVARCKKGQMVVSEHACCRALNCYVDWLTAFEQYRSEISQPSNAFETRRQLRSQRVGSFSLTHLESSFFIDAFCLCYLFCHLQFVFVCALSLWIKDGLDYKIFLEMWLDLEELKENLVSNWNLLTAYAWLLINLIMIL